MHLLGADHWTQGTTAPSKALIMPDMHTASYQFTHYTVLLGLLPLTTAHFIKLGIWFVRFNNP